MSKARNARKAAPQVPAPQVPAPQVPAPQVPTLPANAPFVGGVQGGTTHVAAWQACAKAPFALNAKVALVPDTTCPWPVGKPGNRLYTLVLQPLCADGATPTVAAIIQAAAALSVNPFTARATQGHLAWLYTFTAKRNVPAPGFVTISGQTWLQNSHVATYNPDAPQA